MEADRGTKGRSLSVYVKASPFQRLQILRSNSRFSTISAEEHRRGFRSVLPSAALPFYYIAPGSLNETFNHLIDGRKREFLDEEEFVRLRRLTFRAIKALRRLVDYLEGAGQRFNRKPSHSRRS